MVPIDVHTKTLECSRSNTKETCTVLNFDLCDLQIKTLSIMSCLLIRYTYDKNLEMIQPALCWFSPVLLLTFNKFKMFVNVVLLTLQESYV
jgi:hypothetical protein